MGSPRCSGACATMAWLPATRRTPLRLRSPSRKALLLGASGLVWALAAACSFPGYRVSECSTPNCSTPNGGEQTRGGEAAAGASTEAGAPVDGGAPSEGAAGGAAGGAAEGIVEPGLYSGAFRILTDNGLCLDASGELTFANHVSFQQTTCDGSVSQSFTLVHAGDGYYDVVVTDTSDCMDVEGGAPEDGTAVVRSPCDQRSSQRWLLRAQPSSTIAFINQQTSKCLDVPAGRPDVGLSVNEYKCNQTTAQTWRLLSLVPLPLPVVVDQHFFASVVGGANPQEVAPSTAFPTRDCNGSRAPNARGDCHILSWAQFPVDMTASGAHWLNFPETGNRFPGKLIVLGAKQLLFQARGESGGEKVVFHATSVSSAPPTQTVTLERSWQQYSLDLTGFDYSAGATVAMAWHVELPENTAPLRFYVDDIVWE